MIAQPIGQVDALQQHFFLAVVTKCTIKDMYLYEQNIRTTLIPWKNVYLKMEKNGFYKQILKNRLKAPVLDNKNIKSKETLKQHF